MKIDVRHNQDVTVLEPKGKITIGVGDVALREAVAEALEAGSRNILLNDNPQPGSPHLPLLPAREPAPLLS